MPFVVLVIEILLPGTNCTEPVPPVAVIVTVPPEMEDEMPVAPLFPNEPHLYSGSASDQFCVPTYKRMHP